MSSDLIAKALKTAVETKDIVFGDGVTDQTGEIFTKLFPGAKALVVADGNTFEATGEEVVASLEAAGVEFAEDPYIFPGKPTLYAGYENVEILRDHIAPLENTIVCSIGSGTLNDIAKLASGELGRPYMNVCTAASVDGFAAFGASISRDGFKITRSCPGPAGLVADNDVVCHAPKRLTATGYGDLIEKIPAGADWILADALGIEPINEYVWNMVQGPLRGLGVRRLPRVLVCGLLGDRKPSVSAVVLQARSVIAILLASAQLRSSTDVASINSRQERRSHRLDVRAAPGV